VRFREGDLIVANHKYTTLGQQPIGIVLRNRVGYSEGVYDDLKAILWCNGQVDHVPRHLLVAYYTILREDSDA
jgi:hypothetical protein